MSILATIGGICSAVIAVCTAVSAVCKVAESVVALGKAMGLIHTKDSQEQLGVRCLAAEEQGITPEAFDHDYSAYLKAVNSVDISNVDPNQWTKQEKALKAIEVVSGAIVHDYGKNAEQLILALANHPESDFFTTERMNVLLNKAADNEIDLPNVLAYIQGGDASAKEARQDLLKVEQILNPDLSKDEALEVIDEKRENIAAN